jgi:hypothetical protein
MKSGNAKKSLLIVAFVLSHGNTVQKKHAVQPKQLNIINQKVNIYYES